MTDPAAGADPTEPADLRSPADPARLGSALARLRARIAAAEQAAGRPPGSVTLVAVSKTWPATDVVAVAALGVTQVGENRADEVLAKTALVAAIGVTGLTWRFVGQLQTRKAAAVAGCCDVVESVDRPRLVDALAKACDRSGRRLQVLLQVDLDGTDPGRGGARPDQLPALADRVAATAALDLAGLMAVAPPDAEPARAFARMADLHAQLLVAHPAAAVLSAGMSGDLEQAVAAGTTHVRVGSALFGGRPAAT